MSDIINGEIYVEKPQQCDFCAEIRELRPYGPKGETICFKCMKKNKSAAEKQLDTLLKQQTAPWN